MTWSLSWQGKACDSLPDNLTAVGAPGPVYKIARDAIWESLQAIAELDPTAHARVAANGWEAVGDVSSGRFALSVEILKEPSEVEKRIEDQQPVDLRSQTA